jgi:hypothetical protein
VVQQDFGELLFGQAFKYAGGKCTKCTVVRSENGERSTGVEGTGKICLGECINQY